MIHVLGKFMGANLKSQTFGDTTKTSIMVNVFVPDSPSDDKLLNIKCDDITRLDEIRQQYKIMDDIHLTATLYPSKKQEIYYTLVELEPPTHLTA